ncbi:hypothetical protein Poli38472_003357 [Pythium oligandrum]|uniref:RING-type domain-containing protein n=1 Tax=Pythium oligandrum TaxID=41045 RepID=A0A8K1C7G8_PYTOL|nr:hypothetical protein Poli38472_003357 [Pythium oligandrum]|eukprot:TMW57432.1 hypothetical protein Poli38472_003357 [Pythium oligandrum]
MKRRTKRPEAGSYSRTLKEPSTIINAAALQDHLVRSMALNTLACRPKPLQRAAQVSLAKTQAQKDSRHESGMYVVQTQSARRSPAMMVPSSEYRKVWVEAPPPKLSRDDWERCENQALERGDVNHPCSICRESFGVQEQVILSCSHMFHLACIQSFERFLRTKQRVCPLCRKDNYQKRATVKGAVIHRDKCALRIQTMFRGFRERRRLDSLWHQFYRQGKGDPVRRRRFLANRIGKTTDRLVGAMRARDDSIDALLAEFDKTLSLSRQVFDPSQPQTDDDPSFPTRRGVDWLAVFEKARLRDERECPICINAFSVDMTNVTLLSCSHCFHHDCLHAFEDFNIYEVPLCPVCRASYQKQSWDQFRTSTIR